MPDSVPTYADPLELFRTAAERLRASDWLGCARLCDPVSLRAFKYMTLERFKPPIGYRELTLEDMRLGQPNMPIEVAEYNFEQYKKARVRDNPLDALPGIESRDSLAVADPLTVFAAHLHGTSPREYFRRAREAGHIPDLPESFPQEVDPFDFLREEPIGYVEDESGIGHIVYRHVFPTVEDVARSATSRRHRAMMQEHEQRLAAIPEDVRTFLREREKAGHPMLLPCRRQPGGGWLLLAEDSFLSSNRSVAFGVGVTADDDGDDDATVGE